MDLVAHYVHAVKLVWIGNMKAFVIGAVRNCVGIDLIMQKSSLPQFISKSPVTISKFCT